MNMDSLTKENFWNDLKNECPLMMDIFCKWIDRYKDHNNWNSLFGQKPAAQGWAPEHYAPKFHEIPIAMQAGIMIQFATEIGDDLHFVSMGEVPVVIKTWFLKKEKFFS